MKHLISIEDLELDWIKNLIARTLANPPFHERRESRNPAVGLIFLEESTRTRVSFQRACHNLSLDSVLVEEQSSSLTKDESLEDTILNLRSMGINFFVIRSRNDRVFDSIRHIGNVHFINAGAGKSFHPTQALLDLATIVSVLGNFENIKGKRMTLFGDVLHSRVARSWARLAPKVGLGLGFCGPESVLPRDWGDEFKFFHSKEEALEQSEFVMPLRVHKERHQGNGQGDWRRFVEGYQIAAEDLKEGHILLSPGPVNWGVELHENMKNDKRSMILYQVKLGVHLRASILDSFLNP